MRAVHAFTRTELLLTLAVLALLAVIVLSWRTRAADLPRRKACELNVKNLLTGFTGYLDTNGRLPAAARMGVTNSEDWIHWQTDRPLGQSAVARHPPVFEGSALRCPGDTGFRYRDYLYSYSMNVFVENTPKSALRDPESLILLYEEQSPNDGACVPGEPADALATRHAGKSTAGFSDGHVDLISRRAGKRSENFRR